LDTTRLKAISPLDGRYRDKVAPISDYLSEAALIYYRLEIEIRYLIALSNIGIVRKLSASEIKTLETIYKDRSDENLLKVKEYEDKVKHDVKSVEMFLREVLKDTTLTDIIEKLHYCLTSEDVNNLSYRLMLRDGLNNVILPALKNLIINLKDFAVQNKKLVMTARTHGQDAVPTTLGKEIAVYAVRLFNVYEKLYSYKLTGKLNGAIGGWNAHVFANPQIDWIKFSKKFVEALGFQFNEFSTQINQYDDVVAVLSILHLLNGIMLDFDQDIWRYISDGWLVQKVDKTAVGSSTMAQKVNPINFENSEGNAYIANGLIEALMSALPVSRLQRDLSNSTVIRNNSTICAHELLVINSAISGLASIYPDEKEISEHVNSNWSILAEPLQILLRKYNVNDAFNVIKEKMMGKKLSQADWKSLIKTIDVDEKIKNEALKLQINDYVGYCDKIVDDAAKLLRTI
jgi:adenylosuccinate lyase